MTDRPITLPDHLLNEWSTEAFYIEVNLQPALKRDARRELFTKIARWGAQTSSETSKERLKRLIEEEAHTDLLMEAFNQLEEES